MDTSVCRFCLHDESSKTNPFLSPCACIGSAQYVHKVCLETWRLTTLNAEHKVRCQLCLHDYILPRKWPLEIIPTQDFLWDNLLSQHLVLTFSKHYLHFLCLIYFHPILLSFKESITISLIYSKNGLYIYHGILLAITAIYGTYYYRLIKKVNNLELYFQNTLKFYLPMLFSLCVCFYMTQFTIFPFGGLYIYSLSSFRTVHLKTLHLLNLDGSFFGAEVHPA